MNNQDHISECLETICFDVDPRFGIRDGKNSDPGSGMEKNVDPGCLSRMPEIRKYLRQMFYIGKGSSKTSVGDPDPYRMFWASWIRIRESEVRIRILRSSSKIVIDSYCFVTS
jgi:hypothetical protein